MLTLTYRYSPQELQKDLARMYMGAIVEYFAVAKPSFTKQHLDDYFRGQFDMVWDHVVRGRGVGAKASDMTAAFCTSVKVVQDPVERLRAELQEFIEETSPEQRREVVLALMHKSMRDRGGSPSRSSAFEDLALVISMADK